jgi:hypothetical protein
MRKARRQNRVIRETRVEVRNGESYNVIVYDDVHSVKVAARFAATGRGYAKRGKRHVSDIVSPLGLPTSCRMPGDDRDGKVCA